MVNTAQKSVLFVYCSSYPLQAWLGGWSTVFSSDRRKKCTRSRMAPPITPTPQEARSVFDRVRALRGSPRDTPTHSDARYRYFYAAIAMLSGEGAGVMPRPTYRSAP